MDHREIKSAPATELDELERAWAYAASPLGRRFPRIGWAVFRVLYRFGIVW